MKQILDVDSIRKVLPAMIQNERFSFYLRKGKGGGRKIRFNIEKQISTNRNREKTIASLKEYTAYLETNHLDRLVLFRGQEEDWSLIPRVARLNLNYENPNIQNAEQRMFDEFKKRSIPFLTTTPNSPWDWLALAQHHGMATRLLDWTKNPLAGLWFAVRRLPTNINGQLKYGVVWVFEVNPDDVVSEKSKSNPFEGQKTEVFQPNHITPRIVAQQGWFTVHKYVERLQNFIPFEKLPGYRGALTKLIIPGDDFGKIRYDLDRCGINESTLFPDLDGLCKHLVWDNSLLEDETNL